MTRWPDPERPEGVNWDAKRGRLVAWDRHGMLVVRPWPRPAAWRFRRRRHEGTTFRPRVKLEAWENDDPPPMEPIPPSLEERMAAYDTPFRDGTLDWADYAYDVLVEMECEPTPEQVQQENEERAAAYPAWRTVPVEVRAAALRMEPNRPWRALRALGQVPELLSLAEHVPWLAYALLNQKRVRPTPVERPYRAFRALLRRHEGMALWRAVAGWLGFEPSAALVNVLRRTSVTRGWIGEHAASFAVVLRAVWRSPEARKRLLHAPRIDEEVLRLVHAALESGTVRQLHPGLIAAAWTDGAHGGVAAYFRKVAFAWPILEPRRPLPVLRTQEELDALLESLRRRLRGDAAPANASPCAFPPPPLPDTADVVALSSDAALDAEGAAMGHCIGNGTWSVRARRLEGYGYAVRVGEDRGTVWLGRTARVGVFAVGELRGPRNAPPSDPVVRAVAELLAAHEHEVRTHGELAVPEVWRVAPQPASQPELPPALRDLLEDELPF
jgi:hypothetical protein